MENVVHAGLKHLAFQQVAFRVDYTSPQLNVFDVETESQSQLREKRFRFDGVPLCFQRMMHSKPETMEPE
ncbi:hypothetical protein RSP822_07875 [Ralstonia solanacearum]|nr:hypothetical protein RSP822_07875 [Ralstonia solanacearum]